MPSPYQNLRPIGRRFELQPASPEAGDLVAGPYAAIALRATIPGAAGGTNGVGALEYDQDSQRWFEVASHLFDRVTNNGDLSRLEVGNWLLGQFNSFLIGGSTVRFDSIAGLRDIAVSQFQPYQYPTPLLLNPGNRLNVALTNTDPAEMEIAGYLEGRTLLPRSHPFARDVKSENLRYGPPLWIAQDRLVPFQGESEFRVEAADKWGFVVWAVKLFADDDNVLALENIEITEIQTDSDQSSLYGRFAGANAFPARLWGGVQSDLNLWGAAPSSDWHFLPFPIVTLPNRKFRLVVRNNGATGGDETLRFVAAGQFIVRG